MPYSTCCGAYSTMPEIDICPECRDHCDWEDEEEEEDCCIRYEDEQDENQIEQTKINKTT